MNAAVSTSTRFRVARERAGLSIADTAARAGVSEPCVWDLETHDDELMTVYSPADLQRFAGILSVAPRELVGTEGETKGISTYTAAYVLIPFDWPSPLIGLVYIELRDAAGLEPRAPIRRLRERTFDPTRPDSEADERECERMNPTHVHS